VFTALAIGTTELDSDLSGGAIGGFVLLILLAIIVSIAYFPGSGGGRPDPGLKVFRIGGP